MAEDMREMTMVLLEKGNQQMDCLTIALLLLRSTHRKHEQDYYIIKGQIYLRIDSYFLFLEIRTYFWRRDYASCRLFNPLTKAPT